MTASMRLAGRAWTFGDDVGLERFIDVRHDGLVRARDHRALAPHLLEETVPTFAAEVRSGDLIVAGVRFGAGKHHRGVVEALKVAGIGAVLASSFDPMFQRAAIDSGLPAIAVSRIPSMTADGDTLEFDLWTGRGRNITSGLPIVEAPAPEILLAILDAGGIEAYTLRRLASA